MITLLGLECAGRRCVVVGGGEVAQRRAERFVEAGADVVVVAPRVTRMLEGLATDGVLTWHRRAVVEADLDEAWLVVAATDAPAVNAEVCGWAERRRLWCVNAADAGVGGARMPAQSVHGGLAVGVVSTAEPDPGRSRAVHAAMAAALDAGSVSLRRHRGGPGRVVLVGSGPGDPSLMTGRARQALAEADVVVADRLGARGVLDALPEDVEVVEVGKGRGSALATQEQINAVLVDRARAGAVVVRLKGGDPFVFGRGGEEAHACMAAGVPVEVVPGLSSALAVPALAGIPVTQREVARSVLITSGHAGAEPAAVQAVAAGVTLVVLMGVAHLSGICAALVDAGVDPGTPVAIIESGSTANQRVTRGTLADINISATVTGVKPPAVIVVGEVARPEFLASSAAAGGPAREDGSGAAQGDGAGG